MSIQARDPADRERALTLLSDGATLSQVGREVGASIKTVRRWAKAAHIKVTLDKRAPGSGGPFSASPTGKKKKKG